MQSFTPKFVHTFHFGLGEFLKFVKPMDAEAVEWKGWHRTCCRPACGATAATTLGGCISELPLILGQQGLGRTRERSMTKPPPMFVLAQQ